MKTSTVTIILLTEPVPEFGHILPIRDSSPFGDEAPSVDAMFDTGGTESRDRSRSPERRASSFPSQTGNVLNEDMLVRSYMHGKQCGMCKKSFDRRSNLKRHIITVCLKLRKQKKRNYEKKNVHCLVCSGFRLWCGEKHWYERHASVEKGNCRKEQKRKGIRITKQNASTYYELRSR